MRQKKFIGTASPVYKTRPTVNKTKKSTSAVHSYSSSSTRTVAKGCNCGKKIVKK
ncbi:hypothetical protein [Alkalihalobacillus sp. LMS39]|uniref:hypothetical protein n=1 Tax=Alkalihalobacillus sp. LMS39 TaxID=2924032 RepID=UPI001FB1F656|nr:hypothetical protein [Alkalihalobacillus sp. LMS39]UOE92716.1 hypothetical protein MM271_15945 [Alkalihalobacillus sp. LMS39]